MGAAYLSRVDELALPGCCPQLADRRLLNLLSHQLVVSAKAAEASLVGRGRMLRDCGLRASEEQARLWAEGGRKVGCGL
jgi:hypothetical protein